MAWKKGSKYYNKPTTVNGKWFQSRREARRYQELLLLQRAGEISDLKCQVPFELIPPQKYRDHTGRWKVIRGTKYIADYTYYDSDNKFVVEDVKGVRTQEYKIKKKLMLWLNHILIKET